MQFAGKLGHPTTLTCTTAIRSSPVVNFMRWTRPNGELAKRFTVSRRQALFSPYRLGISHGGHTTISFYCTAFEDYGTWNCTTVTVTFGYVITLPNTTANLIDALDIGKAIMIVSYHYNCLLIYRYSTRATYWCNS